MEKSNILVIYTGGTIGMVKNVKTGALTPIDFDELYKLLPVLENYDYNIDRISFDPLIDSSDTKPDFWLKLAAIIEENYEKYDGFVVLHGSDTMAYSASVLSFLLENLNKPVVFTGSQLPLGVVRTDGRENFINAIEIAAAQIDQTPIVPEVTVFFENRLFRGNRVSKFNAENFQAFISGNFPPLAEAGVEIRYNGNLIMNPNFKKLKVHQKLDNNVAILKLFPGISHHAIDAILNTQHLKAVILETFGSGNAPSDPEFIQSLKNAIERGVIIYNVTQCKGGHVEMGKYATSVGLLDIGVISGHDITTEAAMAKLMFLLASDLTKDQILKLLQQPLRGEMTVE
jgi:L-asparaginase